MSSSSIAPPGETIAQASDYNGQISYGEDVISRIVKAQKPEGRKDLQQAVIKTVTHEEVTKEKLGGAMTHNSVSGVAHFASRTDTECLAMIRRLLSFIPSNNAESPPNVSMITFSRNRGLFLIVSWGSVSRSAAESGSGSAFCR